MGQETQYPLPPTSAVTVWHNILPVYLPAIENYSPYLQWISDIYTIHTPGQWLPDGNGSHVRCSKFFVLEHIPMLDEVPNATWDHAKDQLINCVNSPRDTGDGSILSADTVYGAVVIGRYVTLYRYNRTERTVIPWNQADKEYHIKRQCATVQNTLKQIKDGHW